MMERWKRRCVVNREKKGSIRKRKGVGRGAGDAGKREKEEEHEGKE